MNKQSRRYSSFEGENPPKLSFGEFCKYLWIALKKVKPVGIPIYVAANIYASLGGWPFPDGRYVSIVGVFVFVVWFSIVEYKVKTAFSEARIVATKSEG